MKTRRFSSVFTVAIVAINFIGCGDNTVTAPNLDFDNDVQMSSPGSFAEQTSPNAVQYLETKDVVSLTEIARNMAVPFRVPFLSSTEGSLGDAVTMSGWVIAWRSRFLDYAAGLTVEAQWENVGHMMEVTPLTWGQRFELAAKAGFRVPSLNYDPDGPLEGSLTDRITLTRWYSNFLNFLDERVAPEIVERDIEDITRA